jgi:PPM family protein phosphatase
MSYRYLNISRTGLKRTNNEDSAEVYETENGLLIVLCDGLGGNRGGEIASSLTVKSVYEFFTTSTEADILNRIKTSVFSANKVLINRAGDDSDLKGMATTVEVLYLNNSHAYWGHVGDSRIYYLKGGKLKQVTKDHSLVQKLVDDGFLTLKEAENHPNKNIIMRAMGDSSELEVDTSKIKISFKDSSKFFVCSDGVTAVLRDYEIENILNVYTMEEASDKFIKVIEERGAPDNYTFVIAEIRL